MDSVPIGIMSIRSREIYISDRTMWCLMRLQAARRTVDDTVTTDSIAEAILAEHLLANYPKVYDAYEQIEQAKRDAESAVKIAMTMTSKEGWTPAK